MNGFENATFQMFLSTITVIIPFNACFLSTIPVIIPFNALYNFAVIKRLFAQIFGILRMNSFENAHLTLYYFLLLFYKFIANTIIDRLNFCESNNFTQVTLPDCKIVLII